MIELSDFKEEKTASYLSHTYSIIKVLKGTFVNRTPNIMEMCHNTQRNMI